MTQSPIVQEIVEEAAAEAAAEAPVTEAARRLRIKRALRRYDRRAGRLRGGLGAGAPQAPVIRVAGASSAKRAAERAVGGRAVKVVRKGRRFVVTVVSGGSAKRCTVDAKSSRVLGCR